MELAPDSQSRGRSLALELGAPHAKPVTPSLSLQMASGRGLGVGGWVVVGGYDQWKHCVGRQ